MFKVGDLVVVGSFRHEDEKVYEVVNVYSILGAVDVVYMGRLINSKFEKRNVGHLIPGISASTFELLKAKARLQRNLPGWF